MVRLLEKEDPVFYQRLVDNERTQCKRSVPDSVLFTQHDDPEHPISDVIKECQRRSQQRAMQRELVMRSEGKQQR